MVVIGGPQGEIQKQLRYIPIHLDKQITRCTAPWSVAAVFEKDDGFYKKTGAARVGEPL